MPDFVRTETNSVANPRIVVAWQPPSVLGSGVEMKAGFYQPLDSLSFRILDPTGAEYIASTVVDTADPANQLDPDAASPTRLIVPPFTVAGGQALGTWTIEVTFVAHPEGGTALTAQTTNWTFRVVDEGLGLVDAYAQVTDLINNGFPIGQPAPCTGGFTFETARAALLRATWYVNNITGRSFTPMYTTYDVDGKGGSIVQISDPICGLTHVGLTFTSFAPSDLPIAEGDLRVYNRHMRQRLVGRGDDDRQDPRVEFLRSPGYHFPRGSLFGSTDLLSSNVRFVDSTQNVQLTGFFGYTDWDGSPFGKTPDLIREVTVRLAARYIEPIYKQVGGAGLNARIGGPIISERTLDQSIEYSGWTSQQGPGAYTGAFTGDTEIDQILAMYMAPPVFGSA